MCDGAGRRSSADRTLPSPVSPLKDLSSKLSLVNFTSPCFSGGLQASGASMNLRSCKLQFELPSQKLDYPVRDLKIIPMLLKLSSGDEDIADDLW